MFTVYVLCTCNVCKMIIRTIVGNNCTNKILLRGSHESSFFLNYKQRLFFFKILLFYMNYNHLKMPLFVLMHVCASRMTGSKPAGRNPLWFFLSMLYSREQIHAWILQIIVHNHTVKVLTILGFHCPASFLNLLKVFVLRKPVGQCYMS